MAQDILEQDYPTYKRPAKDEGGTAVMAPAPSSSPLSGEAWIIAKIVDVTGAGAVAVVDAEARAHAITEGETGKALTGQIGSIVKVQVEGSWIYAVVRAVRSLGLNGAAAFGDEADLLYIDMDFVGQCEQTQSGNGLGILNRGISKFPVPGQSVLTSTDHDLDHIFSPREKAHIRIGTVYPTHNVPATLLTDQTLAKHFAILGSTGTGKSCTVALLIHRFVEQLPNGHVLILDPHNEYAEAFEDHGVHFDTENLSLPYWLMNLEEHIEIFVRSRTADREIEIDILKRCLLTARKKGINKGDVSKVTVDTPVPYRLADLLYEIEMNMGKLEKPETLMPFLRLKNKIEELKNDARYSFMFSGLLISDSLGDIVSRLLRFPAVGKPVSTLDLSGIPSDIVDVVVSVMSRLVFDFAVWSRKETSRPLLLVCEEAHRYVPEAHNDRFGAARKSLERIAKEGRKYGVSLGLVSQRPSDLSESVLSQCGTIISMRMNNDRDKKYVKSAMPEGSEGFLESLSSLGGRECIICGEGVTAPVRVKLDILADGLRPSSDDPDFSVSWQQDVQDSEFVPKVIHRWRTQSR